MTSPARDARSHDWPYFLAEFDQFAAADEAANLHAWKHGHSHRCADEEGFGVVPLV